MLWNQAATVCVLLGLATPTCLAQQVPFARSFSAGATEGYRIHLRVRSEVEGMHPVRIGAKTYVGPFSRMAEREVSFLSSRRFQAVGADGAADVEETLDRFESASLPPSPQDDETAKLTEALRRVFETWQTRRVLRYQETPRGELRGLTSDGVPALDEQVPKVLSLWLLRALRPTVALPHVPMRLGATWQEPRAVQLPNWADARGSETGEWLERAVASEPVVRLHVTQQISGRVAAGGEKSPEGASAARFHGESLNTLSLNDGRLLRAVRSAAREITWTLPAVEGLPEGPRFRGRLSVEVRIESCDETSCLSAGGAELRERR